MGEPVRSSRLRLLAAIGVVVVGVLGAVLVLLRLASMVFTQSVDGADPASAFNEVVQAPAALMDVIAWEPDADTPRPMEPATRLDVQTAIANALKVVDGASATGDTFELETWLSGPAYAASLEVAQSPTRVPTRSVHVQVDATLRFYSIDGAITSLTFRDEVVRFIDPPGGVVPIVEHAIDEYDAVVMLEDGNWRIRQLVRTGVTTVPRAERRAPVELPVAGINYVPSAAPFVTTWAEYDRDVAAADLDLVAGLELDTVRVFLDYWTLGAERPDDALLDHVVDFLDLAHERGLGVVVTLFDGRVDHRPSEWKRDRSHLEDVVPRLAGHPALRMWDLKNEPDRDAVFSGGGFVVTAWLDHIGRVVGELDPETPRTIGWSTAESAAAVLDVVEVVSFHHYGDAASLRSGVERLRGLVDGRPLLLGEFGYATNRGLLNGDAVAGQAAHVAEVRTVLSDLGVEGYLAWTLHDLAAPPPGATGFYAGRAEMTYGVIRVDGTPKPAAEVLRPSADLAVVPPAPARPLVVTVAMAATGMVLLGACVWLTRRTRRRRRDRRAGNAPAPEPDSSVAPSGPAGAPRSRRPRLRRTR